MDVSLFSLPSLLLLYTLLNEPNVAHIPGRTMRMKQAKVEADEEIKVFRAQLEKEVSDMASAVR